MDIKTINIWISKVDDIYINFETRNNKKIWLEILKDEIFQCIETKNDIRRELLKYLMEKNNISQEIWITLNEIFKFTDDVEKLYEEFDDRFINNIVISGINNEEYPKYDLFEIKKDVNYDEFLEKYYELDYAMGNETTEVIENLIKEIDKLNITHPNMQIKKAIVKYRNSEFDKAWELINEVDEKYKDLIYLKISKGKILLAKQQYEMARLYFKEVIDEQPNHIVALNGLCEVYMNQGKLLEFKSIVYEIQYLGYFDTYIKDMLDKANNLIIENLNTDLSKDTNLAIEVANSYIELDNIEKSMEVFKNIEPNEDIMLEYLGLATRVYYYNNQSEEAIQYAIKWEELVESFEPNELAKYNKRIGLKNLPLKYQSYIYLHFKENEKSIQQINKAIKYDPNDVEALYVKSEILFELNKYEEVVDICEIIIQKNSLSQKGYILKIKALYELDYYEEAYNNCEEYLEIDKYNLLIYIYKIKCLIESEQLDEAQEILNYLEGEDIESTKLQYFKARILEGRGNIEEAKIIYASVVEAIESNESDIDFIDEVYYQYALIEDEDMHDDERIKLLNKGLKYNENNLYLLFGKANILQYQEKYNESLELLKKIEQIKPQHTYVNRIMYQIYKEQENYAKALEYCNKQIEILDELEDYCELNLINLELGNLDNIIENLKSLDEKYPNNQEVHFAMALYYDRLGITDKAIQSYLKVRKLDDENEQQTLGINVNLANCYTRMKEYDKAIKCYEAEYEITSDTDILYEIFNINIISRELDLAKKSFKRYAKARKIWIFNSEYNHAKGRIAWKKGRLKEAYEYFSVGQDDTCEAPIDAAVVLNHLGKNKKALKLIEKGIQLDENNIKAYIYGGRISIDINDIEKANEYANRAMKKIPSEVDKDTIPMRYTELASLYSIMGDYEKSIEYTNKALDIPVCSDCKYCKCIEAMIEKIYTCKYMGNKEEAIKYCEEALEISKYDEEINYLKGELTK